MTKLVSGRVIKVPSANVSADRYQFIQLSETEPDLGLPAVAGYVLSSDLSGNRIWIDVASVSGTPNFANTAGVASLANAVVSLAGHTTSEIAEGNNLYYTNARVLSNVTLMSINVFADVDITGIQSGGILIWNGSSFTAGSVSAASTSNIALFAYNANLANIAFAANVSNSVISLAGHTTSEIAEGSNLYFTNARAVTAITPLLTAANIANFDSRANAVIYPSLTAANIANFDSRANAVIWPSLNTANVSETSGNLYFTAARVNAVVQPFLTTANVIERNDNLYFTTARANAVIWPSLTAANIANFDSRANAVIYPSLNTANVTESVSNLYYTNARVLVGITTGTVQGNISVSSTLISNAVSTGSLFTNSAVIGSGSGGSLTGANLVSATYIQANNWLNLYTSSVVESTSNLYFTNTRVVSALISGDGIIIEANGRISANIAAALANVGASFATQFANLTTAQVVEVASNLYFTNTRARSVFSAGDNITIESNGRISASVQVAIANLNLTIANLTTASIAEAPSNLYFTYARVNATVQPFLTTANVVELNNLYYTNSRVISAVTPTHTTANIIETSGNLYFTTARVVSTVTPLLTTANIIETSNLYFTNARVVSAVTPLLTTANVNETGSNLYFTTARVVSAVTPLLTTANVIETSANLYFTNARVLTALSALTTANITEASSNLYFTNTRARAVLSAGTGVTYDAGNGIISIGQDVSTTANVTFYNVSITNNLVVYGGVERLLANNLVVSDNMIYLNSGSQNSNPDLGIAFNYNDGVYHHAGFFRDHSDGRFKVFENYSPEPDANIFIDTSHASFRLANIQATTFIGNVIGTVSSFSNHTTTDLAEGDNLYYTNSRVRSTLSGGTGVIYDSTAGSIAIGQNVATTANVQFNKVTTQLVNPISGDIFIGGNLIPSQDSVFNFGSPTKLWKDFYLSATSLFVGNTKVSSNTSTGGLAVTTSTGAATDLTAANIFATGLIYGDVVGRVSNLYNHSTSNLNEGINLYFTNARVITAVTPLLTTSNVIESSSNLYFTYARANAAIWPSLTAANIANFIATVNSTVQPFLTTSNVVETTNQYFTNARVIAAVTPLLTTANVIETSSNLYFTTARVAANVTTLLKSFQGTGLTIDAANGQINILASASAPTANVANFATSANFANTAGFANTATTANTVLTLSNFTTANLAEGVNLYYTNSRVVSAVTPLLTTANVSEISGNLYFTTARANAALWPSLTSANVTETAGNLYFTTARANAALWPSLTTANVTETSSNLYFTYARANAAVWPSLTAANIANFNSTANAVLWPSLTTANVIETAGNLYFTTARVNTTVQPFLTTANVIETSSNLYFTNSRAVSAVTNTTLSNITASSIFVPNGPITIQGAFANTYLTTYGSFYVDAQSGNQVLQISTNNLASGIGMLTFGTAFNGLYSTGGFNFTTGSNLRLFNTPLQGTTRTSIDYNGNFATSTFAAESIRANAWTGIYTANVIETAGNLYFTNARVASNVATLMKSFQGSGLTIDAANGQINILVASSVNSANTVLSLANFTTANLAESSANLYFTNTRARAAFTAGRGIIIMDDGTLKSTVGTYSFDTTISGGQDYAVTSAMNGITFTTTNATDRIILRSLHVTNISDSPAYVSSNVLYATGNTAYMANLLPIPVGGVAEFINRNQVLQPNDKINLQGFNQSLTPTSNILHSYFTYEVITSDITYVGTGQTLAASNTNIQIVTADQADVVIESVKFVNLKSYPIPIKLYIGSANNAPKAYLAYNLQVPPSSSMEVLQSPKLMKYLDNLYANYTNASDGDAIAVFPSYRRASVTTLAVQSTSAVPLQPITAAFQTTLTDGTTLYYTIE